VFGGANAAHPDHPLPWTGGRWGLPEAVEALVAALELALEGCLAEPLRAAAARQRNPAGPRDVLRLERGDASPAAADALLRSLQLGGCEVREERGGAWLVGDPEWGSGWCRSLLRCRAYPGRDAPGWEESEAYDTVANDLAHLAGMRATLAAPGSAAAAAPHVPAPPSRPAAMPRAAAVHVLRDAEPDEDEGWLRWVLEEGRVELRSVAAGEIDSLEAGGERRAVLLLPRNALRGRGAVADQVRDFAARGGRVVAWGKSARAAAEASGARLEEVSPPLATPGVLLATVAAPGEARDALLAGLAAPPAVYATGGPLWRPASDPRVATVLRIAADAALCGRLTPAEARGAAGALAVLRIREGDRGGEWILFAFSPHYRGWTEGTMSLLANAIVGR